MKVIDYGGAEKYIKKVETVTADLDINEQKLVIGFILQRIAARETKQQLKDIVGGGNLMAMVKQAMNGGRQE